MKKQKTLEMLNKKKKNATISVYTSAIAIIIETLLNTNQSNEIEYNNQYEANIYGLIDVIDKNKFFDVWREEEKNRPELYDPIKSILIELDGQFLELDLTQKGYYHNSYELAEIQEKNIGINAGLNLVIQYLHKNSCYDPNEYINFILILASVVIPDKFFEKFGIFKSRIKSSCDQITKIKNNQLFALSNLICPVPHS